ncbi:MAG TPA: hypothetical protein PLO93_03220 [Candidatus Omnitrophota bacterium]|nr:hypothetical protein [Candidatus Omnitrophota bacterium]HQL41286.1 hypothetical protein [Candidatus Omnitrophota bacterium]
MLDEQDRLRYQDFQEAQAEAWEGRCRSCGMCCGIKDGDPCEELMRQEDGAFLCRVYASRLGLHKTKSGREFLCVPIRDILYKDWPGKETCAYQRIKRSS